MQEYNKTASISKRLETNTEATPGSALLIRTHHLIGRLKPSTTKNMPALTYQSSTNFHLKPLPQDLSKESLVGAELVFNDLTAKKILTADDLDSSDHALFRQAVFQYSAVVIRNQQGLDPNTMPALASIWDETVQATHSGDVAALKSEKTVLSQNKAERIPRASQVTIIGEGRFDGYEGLSSVDLHHVVSSMISRMHRVSVRLTFIPRITLSFMLSLYRPQNLNVGRLDFTGGIAMPHCMKSYLVR
jgi:hypothetical protein